MGQTLTHGVYLPDEGERNCYSGLAANWQLLDGAVGTIAEHTTQIAGKAPLVHTHTKADITDFPAYGNAAGTICEGNDSRLSDARTPVAHTHTKSDVTDLFNSANTWSGENTFTKPCKTLGKKLLTGITDLDDAYYNGEVCTYNPNTLHAPASAYGNVLTINNAVNVPDDIYNSWITQIATATDGSYLGIRNRFNGNAWTSWTSILTESRAIPTVTNTYDLGSSSYQWNNLYAKKVNTQSVNGTNPGALSLPNSPGGTGTENVNYYDLSGNITVRDGHTYNRITAPCDGWIAIGTFATWLQISNDTLILATTANPGSDGFAQAFLPVRKGNAIRIVVNQTNTQFQSFKLLPCEGNV